MIAKKSFTVPNGKGGHIRFEVGKKVDFNKIAEKDREYIKVALCIDEPADKKKADK